MHLRNFETVRRATSLLHLPRAERAVMLLIAACGNDDGECDPGTVKPKVLKRACRAVGREVSMPARDVRAVWDGMVLYAGGQP